MPKKIPPLSDAAIRSCKPGTKIITLYDGEGLQLRVLPSGSKAWVFNYVRPYLKTRNNIKLGNYPGFSLVKARETKNQYRQLLTSGIDPQRWLEQQHTQASADAFNTVEYVCRKWFYIKLRSVSECHAFNIRRSFEQHVFPSAGHLSIKTLSAPQIIEILRPLETAQKLETLSRLCQRINELMTWCVNTGLLEVNRLSGIKAAFFSPTHETMKTIMPTELPTLMQRLSTANVSLASRCLIEWQLHTMVRPGEAVSARWQDIDFAKSIWTIPKERMKMQREHTVPLTQHAIGILHIMKKINGASPLVFASPHHSKAHISRDTANNVFRRIGYSKKLVAHGLRALASTALNEHGFNRDWIETALAHIDRNSVRAIYNNAIYIAERRKMMDWWSNYINQAAQGNICTAYAKMMFSNATVPASTNKAQALPPAKILKHETKTSRQLIYIR
jgi:integrase